MFYLFIHTWKFYWLNIARFDTLIPCNKKKINNNRLHHSGRHWFEIVSKSKLQLSDTLDSILIIRRLYFSWWELHSKTDWNTCKVVEWCRAYFFYSKGIMMVVIYSMHFISIFLHTVLSTVCKQFMPHIAFSSIYHYTYFIHLYESAKANFNELFYLFYGFDAKRN